MQYNFDRYSGLIRENLQKGKKDKILMKSVGYKMRSLELAADRSLNLSDKGRDEDFFNSLQQITGITGKQPKYHEQLGLHPDFADIKHSKKPEYYPITSMFVDIRRSTQLHAKYYPFTVANITSTIQHLAMHIAWYFDGYVHRLHGDGLLVYFGGKNTSAEMSAKNAVMAASIFTRYVDEELRKVFLEQGIQDIHTRIGIDFGDAEDTLWYLAGIENSSEVTTCSLHTSLAAHMQGNARANGIMVGDNIKHKTAYDSRLFSIRTDSKGVEDRYIFQDHEEDYNYTQWEFNWSRFLKDLENSQQDIGKMTTAAAATTLGSNPKPNIDYLRSQAAAIKPYGHE